MGTGIRTSRRQARDHAEYWSQPQAGALTYVALGDSAGVGVGVDDPQHGYVGLLAQRLAEATAQPVRTVNLCVSGARARDVLDKQMPQLDALAAPDFVTCVVGGNDVAWSPIFRPHEFGHTMHAIAARLPQGSVMGFVPHFMHWPYTGRARRANLGIAAAATANGHAIADLHAATTRLSIAGYLRTFAGDLFHPNELGHALWADALWDPLSHRATAAG